MTLAPCRFWGGWQETEGREQTTSQQSAFKWLQAAFALAMGGGVMGELTFSLAQGRKAGRMLWMAFSGCAVYWLVLYVSLCAYVFVLS